MTSAKRHRRPSCMSDEEALASDWSLDLERAVDSRTFIHFGYLNDSKSIAMQIVVDYRRKRMTWLTTGYEVGGGNLGAGNGEGVSRGLRNGINCR